MYLAQTSDALQAQAPFYINILENIIENQNSQEKRNIDIVIKEAKEIANGNKEIYTIDNNHYFLITTLLTKFRENLIKLQENDYNNKTYNEILNVLR